MECGASVCNLLIYGTENNMMKAMRYTVAILMLLTFFWGCQKDIPRMPKAELATLELSLPGVVLRGEPHATPDALLNTIRVMVFDKQSGVLETQRYFTSGEQEFQMPFSVEAHKGAKKIYVIANEPNSLTTSLSKVIFEDDLQKLYLPTIEKSIEPPLPMMGMVESTLKKKDGKQTVEVLLTRVVAQISLSVQQKIPEGDELILKEAQINHLPKHSMLFSPDRDRHQLGESWTYTITKDVVLRDATTNQMGLIPYIPARTLYVYENLGTKANHEHRQPQLKLTALYNGVQTTYEAYINEEDGNQLSVREAYYTIQRNHHYHVDATITKIGDHTTLQLQTKVLPWDKEASEVDLFVPELVSLIPQPEGGKSVYTIQGEQALELKVKIKSAQKGIWRASLTNTLDFAFKLSTGQSIVEGIANGESEYTITITPVKPAGNQPRATDLVFTVDYEEVKIPILGGRITIQQASYI